jgi:hypothetical protein
MQGLTSSRAMLAPSRQPLRPEQGKRWSCSAWPTYRINLYFASAEGRQDGIDGKTIAPRVTQAREPTGPAVASHDDRHMTPVAQRPNWAVMHNWPEEDVVLAAG